MSWEKLRQVSRGLGDYGRRTIVLSVSYIVEQTHDVRRPSPPTVHVSWSSAATRSPAWDELWALLVKLVTDAPPLPREAAR